MNIRRDLNNFDIVYALKPYYFTYIGLSVLFSSSIYFYLYNITYWKILNEVHGWFLWISSPFLRTELMRVSGNVCTFATLRPMNLLVRILCDPAVLLLVYIRHIHKIHSVIVHTS